MAETMKRPSLYLQHIAMCAIRLFFFIQYSDNSLPPSDKDF